MRYLLFVLLIACSLFNSVLAKSICCGDTISSSQIFYLESYCFEMINTVRIEEGLKPLKYWPSLADCAREHSKNMAYGKVPFGHQGFEKRAKKMKKEAPLRSFGENVAYNYNYSDPIAIAVKGWMESQGHKENILGDFEETGIGIAFNDQGDCFITQLFAKRHKNHQ